MTSPTSIQEALLCPFFLEEKLSVAIVLRRGRQCLLFTVLQDLVAAASLSEDALAILSRELKLPSRILDGQEGALLAHKVILAELEGRPHVQL